jgi:AraC-like DNA-binding protein
MNTGRPCNRLWLPCAGLSCCVLAIVSRDTLGACLSERERLTHVPAGPYGALSWYLTGRSVSFEDIVEDPRSAPHQPLPADCVLSGPRLRPHSWWDPGPSHRIMVVFWPDAMHALTGIDMQSLADSYVPATHVLPSNWQPLLDAVPDAPDDDARVALIESFLLPLWRASRSDAGGVAGNLGDWVRMLALRAHTSAAGRSLRQVERRVRMWAGQPLRELRIQSRMEQSFFRSLASARGGGLRSLADAAASDGFADQAHLSRQAKRITGFTPQQMRHRFFEDEAFWLYRLWEEAPPERRSGRSA